MLQTKIVDKIKAHFTFNNLNEDRATYEIKWKNIVEADRPQMTIWRTHIACWIPKAKNTLSEYVILIAFLLQQGLHKHSSALC
jgi:hypothetical protein